MSYKYYNPNKRRAHAKDCTVRALSLALGVSWLNAYAQLCLEGAVLWDMPSANDAWRNVLASHGFRRGSVPDTCPECYTVRDFAEDHPRGIYVVAVADHVLAIRDGDWYDTFDSADERVLYYYIQGSSDGRG